MKKLFARLRSMPKRVSAITILAAALIVPAVTLAWGPSRDTFTTAVPATHVVFNSITDNPVQGDERNFMQIKDASAANSTYTDSIAVQAGHEYTMFVYYHNDASSSLNASGVGIATGASVRSEIPAVVDGSTKSVSYVGATNATPTSVWDDVTMTSTSTLNLSLVSGSAHIYNKGATNGAQLSDNIITSGDPLGYNALDGVVPGCNDYAGYVTFNVKVTAPTDTSYTFSKLVSKHGANTWVKSYKAQPGETVDYLLQYKNTGNVIENNVVLKDALPAGETYVAGSTTYGNAINPSGLKASDNVAGTGINVGAYNGGGNAWVIFSAKVADNDSLKVCGTNTLVNSATAIVSGTTKDDTANVTVDKTCTTPVTPTYVCSALEATKISGSNVNYSFKTTASASNGASIVNYIYNFGDGTKLTSTDNTVTHAYPNTSASYTASVSVTVLVNGVQKVVTGYGCSTDVNITIPVTPIYACTALTATLVSGNEYSLKGTATASNGASIVNYIYNFGDGTQSIVTNAAAVTHTYGKAGTTYNATFSVTVSVNGVQKVVTGSSCAVKITTAKTAECKPGVPVGDAQCATTPVTPTTPTTPTTPVVLPHTGEGFNVGTFLGLGALIASIGYYITSRRALLGR